MVSDELSPHFSGHFVALILDNEVTVGEFVTAPPLPWIRLVDRSGAYRVGDGYPSTLTAELASREGLNWDQVHPAGIFRALSDPGEGIDFIAFGNNAGQGLPLAQSLSTEWRGGRAGIIFASGLPEREAYEDAGFRTYCRRRDLLSQLTPLAEASGKPIALAFINTIQHNDSNFHVPWTERPS